LVEELVDIPVHDPVFRFASQSGTCLCWMLRRNCSVTPSQLGWSYLFLCSGSLGVAALFWVIGFHVVMGFAGLELFAVGVAFLVFARHATDGERISLEGSRLVVEKETAGRLDRSEFRAEWVRVEPKSGHRSLIEVSAQGRSVEVGRFVRPELRQALAREIRSAVRSSQGPVWASGGYASGQ
jgi:uncharacterized membrane protein